MTNLRLPSNLPVTLTLLLALTTGFADMTQAADPPADYFVYVGTYTGGESKGI